MRILFIPSAGAVWPHLLPLIALNSRLNAGRHETAFLVPGAVARALEGKHLNILDNDYQRERHFRNEMRACGRFKPDVIVDDLSPTALLTTKVVRKPRVTIRRTGDFPGRVPSNPTYGHSSGKLNFERFYRHSESVCGVPPPTSLSDVCVADMNIIPGISRIEVLPPPLCGDPAYVFAGSLTVPDHFLTSASLMDAVRQFLDRNRSRRIAYVTFGVTYKARDTARGLIRQLLDHDVAVMSDIEFADDQPSHPREIFFHAPFLPMDIICSRIHVMVHHCGSGTYQYAVRHKVPSICIGSRCYDRDDVAIQLQGLGVAKYIPADGCGVIEGFREVLSDCFDSTSHWYKAARTTLENLKAENDEAAAAFDFEAVLHRAVSAHGRATG